MLKNNNDHVYKLDKNGYLLEYQVKRSKRAKHLRIEVGTGGIKVTVPWGLPDRDIPDFIEQKKEWIIEKYTILQGRTAAAEKKFIGGETFLFQGEELSLLIAEDSIKKSQVWLEGKRLIVLLNHEWDMQRKKTEIRRGLKNWYIGMAREVIEKKAEHFSHVLNVRYHQIYLKEQKTRWGSCSSKGNLNFNWKIIMAPPRIIEYIIVHELCHLIHMNHSKSFWGAVEAILSDYRERKKWLKENGHLLSW